MKTFAVERDLKGIAMADLAAAQQAAIATARSVDAAGAPVRYVRSVFLPGDGRCTCLFQAEDAATVRRVNDEAKLPYTRIVEAMDLPAP